MDGRSTDIDAYIYMYKYIHVYIYTYLYMYLYVCMSLPMDGMSTDIHAGKVSCSFFSNFNSCIYIYDIFGNMYIFKNM
jgi:hypothetical protein